MRRLKQIPAAAIRAQVLRGIAGNRTPGLHFPGYFLDLTWPHLADDRARVAIADGAHCRDADGTVDVSVLALLADSALATAARTHRARRAACDLVHAHAIQRRARSRRHPRRRTSARYQRRRHIATTDVGGDDFCRWQTGVFYEWRVRRARSAAGRETRAAAVAAHPVAESASRWRKTNLTRTSARSSSRATPRSPKFRAARHSSSTSGAAYRGAPPTVPATASPSARTSATGSATCRVAFRSASP